jgi:hypothetical protein
MNDASIPVFYDCEASELDEGYIIEIGWAFSDGENVVSAGSLIRPLPAWNIDDAWSSEAESLHGISLARLREQGRPAEEVARMMNEALVGRELFSDDPAYDVRWLGQLFDAAGVEPGFVVSQTPAPHFLGLLARKQNFGSAQFERVWEDSRREHRDRAEADALGNAKLWRTIMRAGSGSTLRR